MPEHTTGTGLVPGRVTSEAPVAVGLCVLMSCMSNQAERRHSARTAVGPAGIQRYLQGPSYTDPTWWWPVFGSVSAGHAEGARYWVRIWCSAAKHGLTVLMTVAFLPPPLTVTSAGMIWVTLNMTSAANHQGIVREFHIVWRVVTLNFVVWTRPTFVNYVSMLLLLSAVFLLIDFTSVSIQWFVLTSVLCVFCVAVVLHTQLFYGHFPSLFGSAWSLMVPQRLWFTRASLWSPMCHQQNLECFLIPNRYWGPTDLENQRIKELPENWGGQGKSGNFIGGHRKMACTIRFATVSVILSQVVSVVSYFRLFRFNFYYLFCYFFKLKVLVYT